MTFTRVIVHVAGLPSEVRQSSETDHCRAKQNVKERNNRVCMDSYTSLMFRRTDDYVTFIEQIMDVHTETNSEPNHGFQGGSLQGGGACLCLKERTVNERVMYQQTSL